MSRLCPIKPLLRQLGDNAYRGSPALISGEPRELRYIALGAAHSLLQCVSPDVAQSGHDSRVAQCPLSGVKRTSFPDDATSAFDAVDGAHSAASRCHRVVASKRTT